MRPTPFSIGQLTSSLKNGEYESFMAWIINFSLWDRELLSVIAIHFFVHSRLWWFCCKHPDYWIQQINACMNKCNKHDIRRELIRRRRAHFVAGSGHVGGLSCRWYGPVFGTSECTVSRRRTFVVCSNHCMRPVLLLAVSFFYKTRNLYS